jgi:hypothetical protein
MNWTPKLKALSTLMDNNQTNYKKIIAKKNQNTATLMHEDMARLNLETRTYLGRSIPSSPSQKTICPSLSETCCLDSQFLFLFKEFESQKDKLLLQIRFYEKIVQIVNMIRPDSIRKIEKLIISYSESDKTFHLSDYFKDMSAEVNADMVIQLLSSLNNESSERLREYKELLTEVIKYYSGFVCGMCNPEVQPFVQSIQRSDKNRVYKYDRDEEIEQSPKETLIEFDTNVCRSFGGHMYKRVLSMVFLRRLALVANYLEVAQYVKTSMQKSSQGDETTPKLKFESKYNSIKELRYWRSVQPFSMFCSHDQNFSNDVCLKLCRNFFGLLKSKQLDDEVFLLRSILKDFFAVFFDSSKEIVNKANHFDLVSSLDIYEKSTCNQNIPSLLSSNQIEEEGLLNSDQMFVKLKDVVEAEKTLDEDNDPFVQFYHADFDQEKSKYDLSDEFFLEYSPGNGLNLFNYAMTSSYYNSFSRSSDPVYRGACMGILLLLSFFFL